MKKIASIIISTLVVLGISSFDSEQSQYGPWQTSHCFKGLDYCVSRDYYNEGSRAYKWWVKFKNRYTENISFNSVLKASDVQSATTTSRGTLQPGEESENWFMVPDENNVRVFIDKVRFREDISGPYASCDN